MTTFLTQLDWRFATKSFDTTKKVSPEDYAKILDAIRKAPTSYGLQPFHVYEVTSPTLRSSVKESAYGQAQVTDASHLLVFAVRSDVPARIEAYIDLASGGDAEAKAGMESYRQMMHGALGALSPEAMTAWSGRQMYIALGFAMAAAAELQIDSCPMEGFDAAAVTKLLELPEGEQVVAMLALGYRTEDPTRPKVRFPDEDLFTVRA